MHTFVSKWRHKLRTSTSTDTGPLYASVSQTQTHARTHSHSLTHSLSFSRALGRADIQFWRTRKSVEGLSIKSIFINLFFQTVILLYLFDNDTSYMILIRSVPGGCLCMCMLCVCACARA